MDCAAIVHQASRVASWRTYVLSSSYRAERDDLRVVCLLLSPEDSCAAARVALSLPARSVQTQ